MGKLILIAGKPVVDENESTFGTRIHYVDLFQKYGEVVITSNLSIDTLDALKDRIGLLVLPGGADISPSHYTDFPSVFTGKSDPYLEYADSLYLTWAIQAGKPVFGICRGLQAINVFFGGTLEQDNQRHHPRSPDHETLAHPLILHEIQPPHAPLVANRRNVVQVNSLHHQSIDRLAPDLEVLAKAPDQTIEAVLHKTYRIGGVQWHPEFFNVSQWLNSFLEYLMEN